MPIVEQLNQDLKTAMLARDSATVEALKTVKTALQYAAVPPRAEAVAAMSDEQVQAVLSKEVKKRQESADMYQKAGATDQAAKELAEKALIERYLPAQLTDDELAALVDEQLAALSAGGQTPQLGQVIGAVKTAASGRADGGRIAQAVKGRLQ